jgi:hypothetical protein
MLVRKMNDLAEFCLPFFFAVLLLISVNSYSGTRRTRLDLNSPERFPHREPDLPRKRRKQPQRITHGGFEFGWDSSLHRHRIQRLNECKSGTSDELLKVVALVALRFRSEFSERVEVVPSEVQGCGDEDLMFRSEEPARLGLSIGRRVEGGELVILGGVEKEVEHVDCVFRAQVAYPQLLRFGLFSEALTRNVALDPLENFVLIVGCSDRRARPRTLRTLQDGSEG